MGSGVRKKKREAGGVFPKILTNNWTKSFVLPGVDGRVLTTQLRRSAELDTVSSPEVSQLRR